MKKIKIILFSIVSLITILISCSSNELTNTKNDLEIIENEKDSIIVNIVPPQNQIVQP